MDLMLTPNGSQGVGLGRGAWVTFYFANYDDETDTYNVLESGHMVTVVGYVFKLKQKIMYVVRVFWTPVVKIRCAFGSYV